MSLSKYTNTSRLRCAGLRPEQRRVAGHAAVAPCGDPFRPHRDRVGVVAARVELLATVQPAVDEIRRHIHQPRPFDRVGADQRHARLRAAGLDELASRQNSRAGSRWRGAAGERRRSSSSRGRRGARRGAAASAAARLRVVRQQRRGTPPSAPGRSGNWAGTARGSARASRQAAARPTRGNSRPASRVAHRSGVGDEARCLDREDEIVRHLLRPVRERVGPLQAVERAIHLDGAESARRVGQLVGSDSAPSGRTRRARAHRSSRRCRSARPRRRQRRLAFGTRDHS